MRSSSCFTTARCAGDRRFSRRSPGIGRRACPGRPVAGGDAGVGAAGRLAQGDEGRGDRGRYAVEAERGRGIEEAVGQRPTCSVRAVLASMARRRARSAIMAGNGPARRRRLSSSDAGCGRSARRRRPVARRNRRARRRAGRDRARARPRRGSPIGSSPRSPRRRRPWRACTGSCRRSVPNGRLAMCQATVRRNCRVVMRHGLPSGPGGMIGASGVPN